MGKATVYIRVGNEERWNKKGNFKSEWLNKQLELEAEQERIEMMKNPQYDPITGRWSDSD